MLVGCSSFGTCCITGPFQASDCSTLAITLRCSKMAPLLTPVVPPVYCSSAMSSGCRSGFLRAPRAPCASAWLKRTACGRLKAGTIFLTLRTTKLTSAPLRVPSWSPMALSTTCLRAVLPMHFSSVWAKFSMMTMALAPESLSWCSSSRGVYSGLTLTTTSPARSTAATATGYCGTFGIMMATRSPRARPRPCR